MNIHAIPILLLIFVALGASELPHRAERALEHHARAVAEAEEAYHEAVERAAGNRAETVADSREELFEVLDREIERATRQGDLDSALAIRARKEELVPEAEQVVDLVAEGGPQVPEEVIRIMDRIPEMTEAEWAACPGNEITVSANTGIEIGMVPHGGHILWIPHPDDTWDGVNWEGHRSHPNYNGLQANAMQMIWEKDGEGGSSFLISGDGRVRLTPNATNLAPKTGSIRVKVLKIR